MAIVKMSKFRLVCLDYDKEEILNALYKTGKAEVTANGDLEDTFLPENDCGAENCRALYEMTKGGKRKTTFEKLGVLSDTCAYFYDHNF